MRPAVSALSACNVLDGMVACSERKLSSTRFVTSVTIVFMSCRLGGDDDLLFACCVDVLSFLGLLESSGISLDYFRIETRLLRLRGILLSAKCTT